MTDTEKLLEITDKLNKLLKFCEQKRDNAKALYEQKGEELKTEKDPNKIRVLENLQCKYWGEYETYHTTIIHLVEKLIGVSK